MHTKDGGLAYTLYGPCSVEADGISLNCATDFPFGEDIKITVGTGKPVRKALSFRIPDWCDGVKISVNGEPVTAKEKDGFLRVCRKWEDGDIISLSLPMKPAISEWEDNCYPQTAYFLKPHWGRINEAALDTLAGRKYDCITYGPLLYALPLYDIDENTIVPGQKSDYMLHVTDASQIEVQRRAEMPERWGWRIDDAPIVLYVPAEADTITLVPYNCTKFRISMFRKP